MIYEDKGKVLKIKQAQYICVPLKLLGSQFEPGKGGFNKR